MQIIINIDETGEASVETSSETAPATHGREDPRTVEGDIDVGAAPAALDEPDTDATAELFEESLPGADAPDDDDIEGFVDIGPPERLPGRQPEEFPGGPPGASRITTRSRDLGLEEP